MARRAIPRDLTGITSTVALASAEIVFDTVAKGLRVGDGAKVGGHFYPSVSDGAWKFGLTGVLQSLWGGGFENNTQTIFAGSKIGRAAVIAFTRSSDNPSVGDMGTYAVGSFAEHNSNKYAWAGYDEIRRRAGAGSGHGREVAIINFGSSVNVDPFNASPYGTTDGLRVSTGRDDTPGQTPISALFSLISVGGGKALKGINFAAESLVPLSGGQMDAINFAPGMAVQEWLTAGVRGSFIRFDTTDPFKIVNIVLANDAVSVNGSGDQVYARFSPTMSSFSGAGKFGVYPKAVLATMDPSDFQWGTVVVEDDTSNRLLATSDGTDWRFLDGTVVPSS